MEQSTLNLAGLTILILSGRAQYLSDATNYLYLCTAIQSSSKFDFSFRSIVKVSWYK